MRLTWTRFFVVGLCLLLCAGVLWGKKGAPAASIDRQDIVNQLNEDRDGAKRIAAAGLRLEHAKQLLADGDTAGAVDVLNLIARMELPDTGPARTTMTDSYLLLAEVYRDHPTKASAVPYTGPEKMTISPAGDHNWRSFDVNGTTAVRIETLSEDTFGDDTNLNLYGGCSGGTPTDFIEFDDDDGPGFLSLIEVCIPDGEYFVEVGGFNDTATPDDFDFIITELGPCVIPAPDDFEPDNESSLANDIGFRNNGNGQGGQGGRDNFQTQAHSIFPAGDIDFVQFALARDSRVRMETFGDGNPDTIIGLSSPSGQLLAANDDKAPGDFGSRLDFCLPKGPNDDWPPRWNWKPSTAACRRLPASPRTTGGASRWPRTTSSPSPPAAGTSSPWTRSWSCGVRAAPALSSPRTMMAATASCPRSAHS
jgi:hypothetical protein